MIVRTDSDGDMVRRDKSGAGAVLRKPAPVDQLLRAVDDLPASRLLIARGEGVEGGRSGLVGDRPAAESAAPSGLQGRCQVPAAGRTASLDRR